MKQCPNCGNKPILGYINGTVVFGITAATLIGVVLLIYSIIPFAAETNAQGGLTDDSHNQIEGIEYYYEDKTELLLDRGAFLQDGDIVTFDLQIPNKNVTTMDGTISVEGKNYLDIEFRNNLGKVYCDKCKIRVYGDTSGKKISEIQDAVRINVNKGDSITLVITSPEDGRLQTIHIKLQVAYLEQYQRIVSPVLDNDTNPVGK